MSILFEYCAFTAFGRCRVVNEQGDNRLVQLENKDTRLLIGLSMWPGVLFPDIHFLTETKSEQLPLSPCSA